MRESTISCHPNTEAASTERSPQPHGHAAPPEPSELDPDALFWGIDDMHLPWVKLWVEITGDPVMSTLTFEEQRHYVWLLCLKGQGVMDRDISTRERTRIIRETLGIDSQRLYRLKNTLVRKKFIDKDWNPTNWEARQNGKTEVNQKDRSLSDEPLMNLSWSDVEALMENPSMSLNSKEILQELVMNLRRSGNEPLMKRKKSSKNLNENNDIKALLEQNRIEEDISNVHQGDGNHKQPTIKQEDIQTILRHLNDLTGSAFRWAGPSGRATKHAQLVRDVLKQGYTVAQCLSVIDAKARQWLTDDKMRQYLRPSTLFRLSKFETYLDEA